MLNMVLYKATNRLEKVNKPKFQFPQLLKSTISSYPYYVMNDSPTLVVAASKLDFTGYCLYSFGAPDDGRRNRPKHVEH